MRSDQTSFYAKTDFLCAATTNISKNKMKIIYAPYFTVCDSSAKTIKIHTLPVFFEDEEALCALKNKIISVLYDTYKIEEYYVLEKLDQVKNENQLEKVLKDHTSYRNYNIQFSLNKQVRPIYDLLQDCIHFPILVSIDKKFNFDETVEALPAVSVFSFDDALTAIKTKVVSMICEEYKCTKSDLFVSIYDKEKFDQAQTVAEITEMINYIAFNLDEHIVFDINPQATKIKPYELVNPKVVYDALDGKTFEYEVYLSLSKQNRNESDRYDLFFDTFDQALTFLKDKATEYVKREISDKWSCDLRCQEINKAGTSTEIDKIITEMNESGARKFQNLRHNIIMRKQFKRIGGKKRKIFGVILPNDDEDDGVVNKVPMTQ